MMFSVSRLISRSVAPPARCPAASPAPPHSARYLNAVSAPPLDKLSQRCFDEVVFFYEASQVVRGRRASCRGRVVTLL